jgi:hypothetical protein
MVAAGFVPSLARPGGNITRSTGRVKFGPKFEHAPGTMTTEDALATRHHIRPKHFPRSGCGCATVEVAKQLGFRQQATCKAEPPRGSQSARETGVVICLMGDDGFTSIGIHDRAQHDMAFVGAAPRRERLCHWTH